MSIWGSYENLVYEIFYWVAYMKICTNKITRHTVRGSAKVWFADICTANCAPSKPLQSHIHAVGWVCRPLQCDGMEATPQTCKLAMTLLTLGGASLRPDRGTAHATATTSKTFNSSD